MGGAPAGGFQAGAGRITLTLKFETLEEARTRILGCGAAMEVLEPEPRRLSVADSTERIVRLYLAA